MIYIAGPMTGCSEMNYPLFRAVAAQLREAGWEVINPADNPPQPSWEHYMRLSVRQVAESGALMMLPGWEGSRGARLEHHIAVELRIPIYHYTEWVEQQCHKR